MPSLRNSGLTVTAAVLCGLAAGFCLIEGLVLLADPRTIQQHSTTPVDLAHVEAVGAGAVVIGLLLAAACVRAATAGLVASPSGVVVRTVTWSRRTPWERFAGVVAQPTAGGRAWRPAVVTIDGDVVGATWAVRRSPGAEWAEQLLRFTPSADGHARTRHDVREVLVRRSRLAADTPPQLVTTRWQVPPGWPQPPPGWLPPNGWWPPPDWPAPPPDWQWWRTSPLPVATADRALSASDVPVADQSAARWLRRETAAVMVAFLVPAICAALVGLIEGLVGNHTVNNFPLPLPGHQSISLVILILSYVPLAATVPVALLLLARTGTPPRRIGLTGRGALADVAPAVGLALLSYLFVGVIAFLFRSLFTSGAANTVHERSVPAYYVVYALILAATTAVAEETFVNGYLLTRLAQLEWRPWPAFVLSLVLRTSYHAYYGAAVIATIPFGWLVTRSFQKHRRLARPMLAHFLYDATLLTIAVLTS